LEAAAVKRLFTRLVTEKTLTTPTIWTEEFPSAIHNYLKPVIKLDVKGNVISFNPAFTQQFGYTIQDVKKSFLKIFPKGNQKEVKESFIKAKEGNIQSFKSIGVCKNLKTYDILVTIILDANENNIYVIIRNITDLIEKEQELILFEDNLSSIEEMGNIGSFHYDVVSDCIHYSEQTRYILGIHEEESSLTFEQILGYVHHEDHDIVTNSLQKVVKDKFANTFECRIVRKDQSIDYVNVRLEAYLGENGEVVRVVGYINDITDRKNYEHRLYEKEKQLSNLYKNPDVGIWSLNPITKQTYFCSQGVEQISGYSFKELPSLDSWISIIHPEDLPQFVEMQQGLAKGNIIRHKYRIFHKDGQVIWVQDYTIPTLNENGTLIQIDGLISNITKQKVLSEKVDHLLYHDYLTNLPNRRMFEEKLQQLTEDSHGKDRNFPVMLLDIDNFKYINDTLGHTLGDEILKALSARISSYLTPDDLFARLSGDEFGLILSKMDSFDNLKNFAETIIQSLKDPFFINGYELFITVSIGISIYPEDGENMHELLRNADIALFKAELRGKNNYMIISPSSSIESFKIFSLGRDLQKAIANNEMVVYYQPRVDTKTGRIDSAEALIRWEHPKWGLISPSEFIQIAEKNGFITQIEDWVLDNVCQQLRKWKEAMLWTVPISINISAIHFIKKNWLEYVEQTIQNAGISPTEIEFEITETALLNNEEIVKDTIKSLKEMGIRISLDDFGKGYSSLSYLALFPFDVIKIDKSFVQNMTDSQHNLFIVKSIIYLANSLKIDVVAEGVEKIEQLKLLQKEHCLLSQGYLFSRPVPVEEFELLMQKKVIEPIDPLLKEKQNKRRYYRVNFPYPLAADMTLFSFAGKTVHLGKARVLIYDMSIGGLRFFSNFKLPVRGDMILQFSTEILDKNIELMGRIIWKEEDNADITEYGIEFIIDEKEESYINSILNSFTVLMKSNISLDKYKMVKEDKYEYLQRKNK
jgi:diguanylate cyclase (GGDEF)-like protein/PAS domain S-box-containing protein